MDSPLTDVDFNRFRRAVCDASGMCLSYADKPMIESRLRERIGATRSSDTDAYYAFMLRNETEFGSFLDSVSNNLTRFFRNAGHFKAFEYHAIPEIIKMKEERGLHTIRIWSAGCSSGEEPYSIAMVCKEIVPSEIDVEIVATDLSWKSLNRAKEGSYPDSISKDVPDRYLKKYFSHAAGGYRIRENIRKLIKYDYHNLKKDPGLRRQDIIFCRNVMTYFDQASQKTLVDKLRDSMDTDGYLFVGDSESLFGIDTTFEFVKTAWSGLYTKPLA